MNTKILLAIAAALALPACGHKKKPELTAGEWEFPLVEPARPANRAPLPAGPAPLPVAPRVTNPHGFRVPDVTEKLPNLRNQPIAPKLAPGPGGPLSVPAPTPTPGPSITPAPEVTPGPEITPAPEAPSVEAPSE